MLFLLRKLAVGLLVSSFFIMMQAQAGIVEPVYKQLKDPNLDGADDEPSTVSIAITPDGKKMFVMDHLDTGATDGGAIFIYDLTTPFDITTMDVTNRTIVNTTGLGDNLGFGNGKKSIKFNNDGKKVFLFNEHGTAQFHNLSTPYDVASISASTIIADDGINYTDTFLGTHNNDSLKGASFNNDGTKMYLVNGRSGQTDITQVKLTTPFDPSTGVLEYVLDTDDQVERYTMDMSFDDDGTRLYLTESGTSVAVNYMYVWKLSNPFELSSATYVDKWQILGNGNNISPYGWTFGNNGMKLYIGTEDASADGEDIIYEYDLTCPYGAVLCETETASVVGAQVEIAKNVIHQNTSTIFKRFEWLRRNENKTNLNSHNLKLNIYNPILASLTNELQSSFKDFKYTQASLKTEKPSNDKRKWSKWTHGDISFGRVGDKALIKPKEITTKGISFGADRLTKNNNFFGLAMRYGNDDVDIKSGTGDELNSQSLSFNVYGQLPVNSKSNLNALLGVSFLSIDQMISGTVTGERYGKQIYTALSYEEEQNYTRFDIIPYGKAELGITQLSEYTDFGTTATNNVETHEKLTFKTGNASAGFKFDRTLYMDESRISRNGFLEYVVDFTPDIDHQYKNHHDNVTVQNTIKRYSLNNIKGNIGFELFKKSGHTFALNYERFQSLDNSAHTDSLLFKFGRKKNENTNFNVIYDPLKNNNTEISYIKNYDNFNLKVKSNYAMYSKIPDYGAGIEFSATF